MERFARIIDTPTTQVLFFVEQDTDTDETILHQMFRTESGEVDAAVRWEGDKEAHALEVMDQMTEEKAFAIIRNVNAMLEGRQ